MVLVLLLILPHVLVLLGMEISSQVALGSPVSGMNSMDVVESILHGPPTCTLVSHYFIFNFIQV